MTLEGRQAGPVRLGRSAGAAMTLFGDAALFVSGAVALALVLVAAAVSASRRRPAVRPAAAKRPAARAAA